MHRELRAWNREIPESPERMDPVLRILLKLFSGQLSTIDSKIEEVWKNAGNSLVKALCPESKRWPVPAFTVMRAKPTDSVVEVDQHTRFFYKEERKNGQTFFFSPQRKEKLMAAAIKHIFFKSGQAIVDLSPRSMESTSTHTRISTTPPVGESAEIFIAIEHDGPSTDFTDSVLFLKAGREALKQLRWATWLPGSTSGKFNEKSSFCPGLECDIEKMFTVNAKAIDWGGLRKSSNLFKPLEDNFMTIPDTFSAGWEAGSINDKLLEDLNKAGIPPPPDDENYYWVRADLPSGGDKTALQSPFDIYFDCFIAVNKNELTLFKHTGGNRLVEIEIPENIANVLDIISVTDSSGRSYYPRHEVFQKNSQKSYSLEERNNKLVLWFDFSGEIELPPDSLTLNYSVTSSVDANGIEAGKINELYEHHPGISTAINISPVTGAIPAKTDEQIINEVSARLRNRDRAQSFSEIAAWAKTFDPRIVKAGCKNGIERAARGVRRCIIVDISIKQEQFYSDKEINLLKLRLQSFLKSRSQVNNQFKVEVTRV